MTTPPLLERIARHDDLVGLINEKVQGIVWGGAHLHADTRYLYRTEVFPGVMLIGAFGSTMILGGMIERAGLTDDDPCIFDPPHTMYHLPRRRPRHRPPGGLRPAWPGGDEPRQWLSRDYSLMTEGCG
jgi:hypothetical protein